MTPSGMKPPMEQSLPPGLPPGCVDSFRRLLEFPLEDQSKMIKAVDRYLAKVAATNRHQPGVDVALAQRIALCLKTLLGYNSEVFCELHQGWIQAATRYFFLDDDSEPDTRSVIGFDDDAAVANCVALAVGRQDLVVALT